MRVWDWANSDLSAGLSGICGFSFVRRAILCRNRRSLKSGGAARRVVGFTRAEWMTADLALVLAVDGSASVTYDEFGLIAGGMAAALRDPW